MAVRGGRLGGAGDGVRLARLVRIWMSIVQLCSWCICSQARWAPLGQPTGDSWADGLEPLDDGLLESMRRRSTTHETRRRGSGDGGRLLGLQRLLGAVSRRVADVRP